MSAKFYELEASKTIKDIDEIYISKTHHNIYHFICDYLQPLTCLCSDGKLSCPIYIQKKKYTDILKFFTTGKIIQQRKLPVLVSDGRFVQLNNTMMYPDPDYLPLTKALIREQLSNTQAKEIVFVQRRRNRIITNIDNLCTLIENTLNIKPIIYYPEDHLFSEQVEMFHSAKVLIAAHGAALANTLFMQDNTYVIEIMPPEYDNVCYTRYIQALSSGIQHYKLFHGIDEELRSCYSSEFLQYAQQPPNITGHRETRHSALAKDCCFTGGEFKADEELFKQMLDIIFQAWHL
jgi:capsular polysaccharide biosynthesis protein